MFPDDWYPRPLKDYIKRWLDSVALNRGLWVRVDHLGRPMEVMVKGKNKAFIDVSRGARARRNLEALEAFLDKLLEAGEPSEPLSRKSQHLALQRLDQGLGDLLRIVRGREDYAGVTVGRRVPARRADSGVAGVPASRSRKRR